MKAGAIFTLISVLYIAGSMPAGEVDKAKLRELAELPKVGVLVSVGFSPSFGFVFGDEPNRSAKIARVQKKLKADLTDDERSEILGRIHSLEEREYEADEAFAKAVAFCRQKVREHPKDIHWRVRLGDVLFLSDETKEAEALLHRAVQEAPNEWRAWLSLGNCMDDRSFRAVCGNKRVAFDERLTVPALREVEPSEKQIEEMRRLRKEALRCYDRAIKLAPHKELEPYFRRFSSNWSHTIVEAGLRYIKGEKIDPAAVVLAPGLLADLRQIARRAHDDPQTIGSAIFWELTAAIYPDKVKKQGDRTASADDNVEVSQVSVEVPPEESRKFVRECLERLEQLTKHPDKTVTADASEILGEAMMMGLEKSEVLGVTRLYFALGESAREKALEHLRRAVRLDPTRERAWDFLTLSLTKKQSDQAVSVARERIRVKDNAHNRFFLAMALESNRQFDKAAVALRAGIKYDSEDLYCLLGLISLRLKCEDAKSLKAVGKELADLEVRIEEEKKVDPYLSCCLLYGIYHALSDHPEKAREGFLRILRKEKGNPTATRALVALGEPLGPADQQIAIDYIQRQDGRVRRADKHKESPVERIDLRNGEITDDDLFVLTAFPRLHELNLSSSAITDAGLSNLMGLSRLRSLNLDDTKISDEGLLRLKALRDLKHLSLKNTKVTRHGIDELGKALPQVEVHR